MAEESVIAASDEGHTSESMTEGASARTSGSYSSKRAPTDSDRQSLVKHEETACSIESISESPSTSSGRERLPINVIHTTVRFDNTIILTQVETQMTKKFVGMTFFLPYYFSFYGQLSLY
jgi:hypothetical protein